MRGKPSKMFKGEGKENDLLLNSHKKAHYNLSIIEGIKGITSKPVERKKRNKPQFRVDFDTTFVA